MSFVNKFNALQFTKVSAVQSSSSSYSPNPAVEVNARLQDLEAKLASKDAIISDLGERLNVNMQDYANLVDQ